ncbi:MAG: Glutamine synthetase [Streblomastix strix]|uniref:Glutamine synthetase n=1 Tax=Streblomastix strix TaxID=222440 RepID=A0A5J4VXT7_9EUKA|nr:MAG: Glutamine synthetase [Streblomastix strix]
MHPSSLCDMNAFDDRSPLAKIFGSRCFREAIIRDRLPKSVYETFLKTIELGEPLALSIAPAVAKAMMSWALSQGATHYAHWFIPMTNATACKHEAFFNPTAAIGDAILEFPPDTLVRGEPDASSFPNGGLRTTNKARGYTTWDPTSPAFVRDGTLFIPSVFSSYTGEALDRKGPLLKSMEALNKSTLHFLKFFPKAQAKRIYTQVGSEQEYFLIPRSLYKKRIDLHLTGRTLLGSFPPKGQQLEDHYMAHIRLEISKFMADLDRELWELGVPAKTKHNEVAPSQHELALVYETVNIASDHNQMVMEVMRQVAKKNGFACLLHEKPFAGLNGSGKHNNFSITTDTGYNLFKPHPASEDDSLFILSILAMLRSVDVYGDLLRMASSSASNDQRLGGFEAPPSILSVFLGEAVTNQLLEQVKGVMHKDNSRTSIEIVPALPDLEFDDSERNRTSPMAFTGNKFEFRMVGSSQSIARVNTLLNIVIADSFEMFAQRLEAAKDFEAEKKALINEMFVKHIKIVFNGNNYSKEWQQEAQSRGIHNITNTVDALEAFIADKNVQLFENFNVMTKAECLSRYEVELDSYAKTISIESATLVHMVKREVIPAVTAELGKLAQSITQIEAAGLKNAQLRDELEKLNNLSICIIEKLKALEGAIQGRNASNKAKQTAIYERDVILPSMNSLRDVCDATELVIKPDAWPFESYYKLLFNLNCSDYNKL